MEPGCVQILTGPVGRPVLFCARLTGGQNQLPSNESNAQDDRLVSSDLEPFSLPSGGSLEEPVLQLGHQLVSIFFITPLAAESIAQTSPLLLSAFRFIAIIIRLSPRLAVLASL